MSEETTPITEEASPEAEAPVSPAASASAEDASFTPPETEQKSVKTRPKIKVSLSRGQEIQGKVKTITDFGAFIDIDLPQDGLVHISELSRNRIEKVTDVLAVGDEVTVWVKNLDKDRNRISLTMRKPSQRTYNQLNIDDVFEGEVTRIERYGVFVDIGLEREGLVHVSELSHEYIRTPEEAVSVGDKVNVKVIKLNKRRKQVNLSIKALLEMPGAEEEEMEEEAEEVEEEAEEVLSTTMGAAFDAFNLEDNQSTSKSSTKSQRRKSTMDDVIQRTLQTQNEVES